MVVLASAYSTPAIARIGLNGWPTAIQDTLPEIPNPITLDWRETLGRADFFRWSTRWVVRWVVRWVDCFSGASQSTGLTQS